MKDNQTLKTLAVILIMIVIGIAIIAINKFQYNVNYSKNVRLEIDLHDEYSIGDIISIVNEVYEDQDAIVRKSENNDNVITVTVKSITDEQNEELINKINERYETTLTTDNIGLYYNSNVKVRDLIKPYLLPSGIAIVLILVFFAIRYNKLGALKIVCSTAVLIIFTLVLYLTLTSIFNMQINEASIGVGIAITTFCLMYLISNYEKELKNM